MKTSMWSLLAVCAVALVASCTDGSVDLQDAEVAELDLTQEARAVSSTDWPLSREAAQALQRNEAKRLGVPHPAKLKIDDSVSIELILIPGGVFPMGDSTEMSLPRRNVRITKGFFISKYEITWRQYLAVLDEAQLPLSWRMWVAEEKGRESWWAEPALADHLRASLFCEELSTQCGVKARLATEAEWEYACRAGTTKPFGEWEFIDDTKANVLKWTDPQGNRVFTKRKPLGPVPVGQYPPNQWGVHDMMGNVDEWCLDSYSADIDFIKVSAVDPLVQQRGSVFHVVRGGSFKGGAETVFYRTGDAASGSGRGIRLVVEIDDAAKAKLIQDDEQ